MADKTTKDRTSLQPIMARYDDQVLFGFGGYGDKLVEQVKLSGDSECVMYSIGTYADKKRWKLSNLIKNGLDRRLKSMATNANIDFALPIQCYCWPKLQSSPFPLVCIAPDESGKTYSHLMYAISQTIASVPASRTDKIIAFQAADKFEPSDDTQLDEIINHPSYIIISSSNYNVEEIHRAANWLKECAYKPAVSDTTLRSLPPIVRAINIHQETTKLAIKCSESEILITTPAALIECLHQGYLNFSKCKKVIFDDIDISLQLHNCLIRDIIKLYFLQTQVDESTNSQRLKHEQNQIIFFARKWTDLVKQFLASAFPQRILVFGSKMEAAVYANVKFDLEFYVDDNGRNTKLINLLTSYSQQNCRSNKVAVVCRSDKESRTVARVLQEAGFDLKLLDNDYSLDKTKFDSCKQDSSKLFLVSDSSLDFEVSVTSSRVPLNDCNHLIHYSLPDEIIQFDQRFRLIYRHIQDATKNVHSTVFVGPQFNNNHAKRLYDLISRSNSTMNSTKLALRDFINTHAINLCWRWATTGLCRLEKLSREDRFGSYCPNRHSLSSRPTHNRWPKGGQVKITVTNIVSPSEIYFRFNEHRDIDNKKWTKPTKSGQDFMISFQNELNKFKDKGIKSLKLHDILKGKVYGVYFPEESRVDRVQLLGEPKSSRNSENVMINHELEYSKQVPAFKIDHGIKVDVFVKNIFKLSPQLAAAEAKCHRAFCLGYKPSDGEACWLYKATKHFRESFNIIGPHEITAWLRLNSNGCFWLEHLTVSRQLANTDARSFFSTEPHRELYRNQLADMCTEEPSCLPTSERLKTLSKWHSEALSEHINFAFLRQDIDYSNLYLLDVEKNYDIKVRVSDYNKQLIELESELLQSYSEKRLSNQQYLEKGAYCIARISESFDSQSKKPQYTLNRAKIIKIQSYNDTIDLNDTETDVGPRYLVECLDHGDEYLVSKEDIFEASTNDFRRLPFQSIQTKFAHLTTNLSQEPTENNRIRGLIIDLTRYPDNNMKILKCKCTDDGLIAYVPQDDDSNGLHMPLSLLLEQQGHTKLLNSNEANHVIPIYIKPEYNETSDKGNMTVGELRRIILLLLGDVVIDELKSSGIEVKESIDTICTQTDNLNIDSD